MGEMCDFEAEFFPQNWGQRTTKKKGKRSIAITVNEKQYRRYRELGGAAALRKLIEAAPLPKPMDRSPDARASSPEGAAQLPPEISHD